MTNPNGRFGIHGGQYIPETLMNAVIELEQAYNHYKEDPDFQRELTDLLNNYAGRPSRLYYARKMTQDLCGAKIYLKREDLNHTGAHKINNVLGHRGDRRRSARCSHRDGRSPHGYGMRRIHGKRRYRPSGAQCLSDAPSGSRSHSCHNRNRNPEGCRLGSHAGMDEPD